MYKFLILFGFISAYGANIPVSPPPVTCGATPRNAYSCIGSPNIVSDSVRRQCNNFYSECDRVKCIFGKCGWLEGETLKKENITAHFDQFAVDNPQWSPAVQHLKAACLATDLPAQGVFINCPAFDIAHCIISSFIRNALPEQWSSSPKCTYPRQYAAVCPMCPDDCIAPAIPIGSCNACRLLPQTP